MYDRIKYFLKAAETGSFTKAANQMFISPQALTKQIAKLEEQIGGRLFERNSTGVTLTELGEYAKIQFLKIDESINYTFEQLRKRTKRKIQTGFFSALPKDEIITPIISHMVVNHPDYQIGFELIEMAEGKEKLLSGELDFLFTNIVADEDWGECSRYSFMKSRAKIVVSLNHPWSIKNEVTIEDLEKEKFYKQYHPEKKERNETADGFYNNIPCGKVECVPNFQTLLEMLKMGDGFAVFPLAFDNADDSQIKSFDYPGESIDFYTAMIYNASNGRNEIRRIAEEIIYEFGLNEI